MEQYAAAGGLATESLGAIRTVTALNAQPDVITRYRQFLFSAMKVSFVFVSYAYIYLLCICLCRWALERVLMLEWAMEHSSLHVF